MFNLVEYTRRFTEYNKLKLEQSLQVFCFVNCNQLVHNGNPWTDFCVSCPEMLYFYFATFLN
jgi:hypothetical protein